MLRVEALHTYYGHGHILQGVDLEVPQGLQGVGAVAGDANEEEESVGELGDAEAFPEPPPAAGGSDSPRRQWTGAAVRC